MIPMGRMNVRTLIGIRIHGITRISIDSKSMERSKLVWIIYCIWNTCGINDLTTNWCGAIPLCSNEGLDYSKWISHIKYVVPFEIWATKQQIITNKFKTPEKMSMETSVVWTILNGRWYNGTLMSVQFFIYSEAFIYTVHNVWINASIGELHPFDYLPILCLNDHIGKYVQLTIELVTLFGWKHLHTHVSNRLLKRNCAMYLGKTHEFN